MVRRKKRIVVSIILGGRRDNIGLSKYVNENGAQAWDRMLLSATQNPKN